MSAPLRVLVAALVVAAVAAVPAPTDAIASADRPAAAAAAAKKRAPCVRARVGDRRVCLRVGQRCTTARRPAYLAVKLDCVLRGGRRVLAKASPAALRQGRYIALGPSGQPTLEQALAAFDQTVADLPGVDPPAGTVGPTLSGTTALLWLMEFRDELTAAQSAVLREAIGPGPGAVTVNIDPDGNVVPGAAAAARRPRARAAQLNVWEQIVREAVPRMAAHGVRVRHPVTVSLPDVQRGGAGADSFPLYLCAADGLTDPSCDGARDAPAACRVRVYPSERDHPIWYRRQIILHELTHCAEFEAMGSMGQLGAFPQWISDGLADYVAMTVGFEWSGQAHPSMLPTWLRETTVGLFGRTYDAAGFFLFLDQAGANVYGALDPIVRAASAGDSRAAFEVAVRGLEPEYVSGWGPTSVSLNHLPAWRLNYPFVPRPPMARRRVSNDLTVEGNFARYGAGINDLMLDADIIIVSTNATTKGRLVDAADREHAIDQVGVFCARAAGCTCSNGSGDAAPTRIRRGQAYLGLADVRGAGFYKIQGQSLADACRRRAPQDEPEPEGGGGGSGGRGRGLEIRDTNLGLMGTITTGTCRVRGSTFIATGRGGGWRFTMRIGGASRPGSYVIPIGSGATYVTVRGNGTYTTNRPVDGFPGAGSADLARVRVRVGNQVVTKWRISVGIQPLFVPGGDPAASIVPAPGGLIC